MKPILTFAAALCAVFTCSAIRAVSIEPQLGKPVENFTLQDFRGTSHSLDDLRDSRAVVLAFIGTECPVSKLYMPKLVDLAGKYKDRGVSVLAISSNQQDSITKLNAFSRVNNVTFPILKDLSNKVADQVGATRTPEVFVLDDKRVIRYSGRIDDRYGAGVQRKEATSNDLVAALDEVLAGKSVTSARADTVGCIIGRVHEAKADGAVTYSNQIARLFQNRCVECHRTGEIGPFSLTKYEDAVGWAEMIEEVVDNGRMPPWHADPHYGKFVNDRRLSDDEKKLIHQWVADGAPRGNPADLPEPRKYVEGWQLPTAPNQTFYMSPTSFNIPAEGTVKYQNFTIDPGFKEDKWVRAAQVLPGNRSVVHHIIVFVVPPGAKGNVLGRQHFTAYVPGFLSDTFAAGKAKLIPAGSKLVFQVHYTPNGSPQTDRSQIGFVYAKASDVKEQVLTNVTGNAGFMIPSNDPSYKVESTSRAYTKDVTLISMSPHMHFRGKSFRYDAIYPDGRTETLLDVPNYDFNWQTQYNLATPKLLPAGTKLHCVATFDNSADNLANPDPSKNVHWGEQTWEEMMLGYYEIAFSGDAPAGGGVGRIDGRGGAIVERIAERLKDGKRNKP